MLTKSKVAVDWRMYEGYLHLGGGGGGGVIPWWIVLVWWGEIRAVFLQI